MAWIESHQTLANHPKTKRLSRALGISTPQTIGHLHLLWWWALDYAQDGDLSRMEHADIAEACEWEGDPESLYDALVDARWIDSDDKLHDWGDYGGKFIKERNLARERQRKHRGSVTRDIGVTNGEQQRESRGSSAVDNSTEEKRTEEVSKPSVSHPPARGEYTAEFETFWTQYPRVLNNSKGKAAACWTRMSGEARLGALAGLSKYLASDGWQRGFAPHTTTYLNGKLWETDPPDTRASPSNGYAKPEERRPSVPRFDDFRHRYEKGGGG